MIDIYYQMHTYKIGLQYKEKTKSSSDIGILELEPENVAYEELYHIYESLVDYSDIGSKLSIPEHLFCDTILVNMVEIKDIYNFCDKWRYCWFYTHFAKSFDIRIQGYWYHMSAKRTYGKYNPDLKKHWRS